MTSTTRTDPAETAALRQAALNFDWDRGDPADLRRIMSRKGMDLETAAQVFFGAQPARYNMLVPADLLPPAHLRCTLLDSIHRRIACGFYLPDPERGLGRARAPMQDWITRQTSAGAAGRAGRWVFDPALLEIDLIAPQRPIVMPHSGRVPWLQGVMQRLARMIRRERQVKPACELEH
jgi:hypothetical protein